MEKDCITFKLPHRTYIEIEQYANSMGISISDYARKLVEDGYYTEKFGDINKILNKTDEVVIKERPKQEEEAKEITQQAKTEVKAEEKQKTDDIVISNVEIQENVKPKTRTVGRRQLKAK